MAPLFIMDYNLLSELHAQLSLKALGIVYLRAELSLYVLDFTKEVREP